MNLRINTQRLLRNRLNITRGLQPKVIGDLINDNFSRSALGSEYILTTTDSTVSIVANQLQFNKPTTGSFNNYLIYKPVTAMLNNWYTEVTVIAGTLGTTSNGLCIGVKGEDTTIYRDIFGTLNMDTNDTNYQKIQIYQNESGTPNLKQSSTSTQSVSSGDSIVIKVSMQDLVLTTTIIVNSGTPFIDSYIFGLSSPELIQTPFNFCIWNNGGNWTITNFKSGSNDLKNTWLCNIGDSTCQGVGVSNLSNTLPSIIQTYMTQDHILTRCALGSAISTDAANSLNNIKLINSNYYLILEGSNDIVRNIGGDGLQNAKNKITYFVSSIPGTKIILCTPLARNSNSMVPLSSWIVATYGSLLTVIDLYTFTKDGATTNLNPLWTTDGTHLNDIGQLAVANYIMTQAPQIL